MGAMPLQIGSLKLDSPLLMAPMAGITDAAFRLLVREMGCSLVFSPMISAKGLVRASGKGGRYLFFYEQERPIAFQLFGSEPEVMAEAARIAVRSGADLIDINMGCPVPKVVKGGEGAALMREPARAGKIIQAVAKAVGCPVTVKIRKGWDIATVNAEEIAHLAQENGATAVTVHGRTRCQLYRGAADWEVIAQVVKRLSIPVIGSGDVRQPRDAMAMQAETGCAAVMIGRGALGNPWIFRRCCRYLETGELLPGPDRKEVAQVALRHLRLLMETNSEEVAARKMRKHAFWYLKGFPGSKKLKSCINKAEAYADFKKIFTWFCETGEI